MDYLSKQEQTGQTRTTKAQKKRESRDRIDVLKNHVAVRDDFTCLNCGYTGVTNLALHHLVYRSHKRFGAMTPQREAQYMCCLCIKCYAAMHGPNGAKLQVKLVKRIKSKMPVIWRQLAGDDIEEFVNRRVSDD